jgi:NADH:ubiquinone oxidoreductase subunit 6 (subunit J)
MTDELLFWVFSILVCGGAIAVVATQNVVRMAFWLVVSLGSVAALFFLLHADFLGAAQLLIYVGGTVVLLVFGVMLTASGPYVQIRTSPAEMIFGATVGGGLFFVLFSSIGWVDWVSLSARLPATPAIPAASDYAQESRAGQQVTVAGSSSPAAELDAQQQQGRTIRQLGLGFLGLRPDRNLKEGGTRGLAPGYLLPFEIISIHLLVVLIGASYLARAKRRVDRNESRGLG